MPNVNSGPDTSQNKAVSVAGYIVTSANIVRKCHEVNSDADNING